MSAPVPPITQARLCARHGCPRRFNPAERQTGTPIRYCSRDCFLADKPVPLPRPRTPLVQRPAKPRTRPISAASVVQRATVADQACIVCDTHAGHCDPAHIISRAALTDGQDDPRAVVALCRSCHDGYDERGGDLLPYLEPRHRAELAFAVERYGLIRTLERVTNQRWGPVPS